MRKALFGAAVGLLPFTAAAVDLSGRWNVRVASDPGYEGIVLIDGQQRVTVDAPLDAGRPAKYLGYVKRNEATIVEMIVTDRTEVEHINCLVESSELLQCRTTYPNGKSSPPYDLVRVGPAPAQLVAPR